MYKKYIQLIALLILSIDCQAATLLRCYGEMSLGDDGVDMYPVSPSWT